MEVEEDASEEVELVEVGKYIYNTIFILSDLITIIGPTASGKTPFAAELAYNIDGEIISGDSRQVYRHMDLGTGKDLDEYTIRDKKIDYHLIDIKDPGYKYTLFHFQEDFYEAFHNIKDRNKTPILCGGTGLYIESVLKGYNLSKVPKNEKLREELQKKSLEELTQILSNHKRLHNKTDLENKRRIIRAIEIAMFEETYKNEADENKKLDSLIIGLSIDREVRRNKISQRLKTRLEEGMVKEVKDILDKGVSPEDLIYYGLEYKYVTQFVLGELTYEEMFSKLEIAIHQFAKRQMTWFRGMERRGFKINWIDAQLPMQEKINIALELIK